MKKPILILAGIILCWSVEAQEGLTGGRDELEIKIGFNTFGPARKMGKLMTENHFDVATANFLYGGTNEHPDYASVGFTSRIAYFSSFRTKSKIGFMVNYSFLREVFGYSVVAEHLFVSFSNLSVVLPLFKFVHNKDIEYLAGPALMVNSGKETSYGENIDDYTRLSAGLSTGLNIKLWGKHVSSGKLGIHYLLAIPNKMGPFTAENWGGETASIPESSYNFGHMTVGFILCFHLVSNKSSEN